jgi:hypothetical protein
VELATVQRLQCKRKELPRNGNYNLVSNRSEALEGVGKPTYGIQERLRKKKDSVAERRIISIFHAAN